MPPLHATEHDEMDCNDLTREPIITCDLEPEIIQKCKINEAFQLRKTCCIHTDYKHLQNPFLVEEYDKITFLASNEIYAVIASDVLNSLRAVKNSPNWSEWQKSMCKEMELLKEKGTWELVLKPPNAVPL
jgi:hypothetical protein